MRVCVSIKHTQSQSIIYIHFISLLCEWCQANLHPYRAFKRPHEWFHVVVAVSSGVTALDRIKNLFDSLQKQQHTSHDSESVELFFYQNQCKKEQLSLRICTLILQRKNKVNNFLNSRENNSIDRLHLFDPNFLNWQTKWPFYVTSNQKSVALNSIKSNKSLPAPMAIYCKIFIDRYHDFFVFKLHKCQQNALESLKIWRNWWRYITISILMNKLYYFVDYFETSTWLRRLSLMSGTMECCCSLKTMKSAVRETLGKHSCIRCIV